MTSSLSSDTTTAGIRVEVDPEYLPEYSKPEQHQYVFSYNVRITNTGDRWAKLIARHWIIINANGKRQEVHGEGVIGENPELQPGFSYQYSSFCPIDTEWGTMEGSYRMKRDDGEEFDVAIGRFYLAVQKETPVEQT